MIVRDVVAIVDDEPLVLRALGRILAPARHAIATASDGAGLDALLAEPRLAVVLLDLFIDGTPGPERIDAVRRARPDVRVVAMTGRPSVESAVACMRAGAFDYLAKPFTDPGRVRAMVAAAAGRSSDDPDVLRPATGSRALVRTAGPGADWLRLPLRGEPPIATTVPLSLEAYERLALERALRESSGDAADAARRLGIGRSTFYRKAAKLGIDLRRAGSEGAGRGAGEPARTGARVGEAPPIG
jgi:DNA-binding NtrC family response regulator